MGLKLIEVFSNPRQIVKEAFAFPNIKLGLGLLLANTIIASILLIAFFSSGFSVLSAAGLVIKEIIVWLVFGLLLSFFALLVHGKRHSKGKLAGSLTALGLRYLPTLILTIFVLLVPLVAYPSLSKDFQELNQGTISSIEFQDRMGAGLNVFSGITLLIVFIVGIICLFYTLYISYLTVWNCLEISVFKTIIMTIVLLAVSGLVSLLLANVLAFY